MAIENITGDVSCDIKFETITKTYLNDYIAGLAGTTQGTGQVKMKMDTGTKEKIQITMCGSIMSIGE